MITLSLGGSRENLIKIFEGMATGLKNEEAPSAYIPPNGNGDELALEVEIFTNEDEAEVLYELSD